jgi:serine/threonine protein kinase
MSSPFVDIQGNQIPSDDILGHGNTAVVLLQNGTAVKTPLRYFWSSDSDVETNLKSLRYEQDVYRRLQGSEDIRSNGVVECIEFLSEATRLSYLPNRDLRAYLSNHRPTRQLQIQWFCEMARTLGYIHDKCVLVTDIASRNFLLDSNLSIKFSDFADASLLPLNSDMETVDDKGFTTQIDIALLGSVIYEVITGNKVEIDLFKDNFPTDGRAHWPERRLLPSTESIWLGPIIDGCWNGQFRSAHSLLEALTSSCFSPVTQPRTALFLAYIRDLRQPRFAIVCGILGLATYALIGRKRFLSGFP